MIFEIEKDDSEKTLLEFLLKKKIDIHNECGGMGICGTCRVKVLSGSEKLSEPGEFEIQRLDKFAIDQNERLACQIECVKGLKINIPI